MTDEELELVAVLVRIGQEDRDLYRQIRRELWQKAAERHRAHTPAERARWLGDAS